MPPKRGAEFHPAFMPSSEGPKQRLEPPVAPAVVPDGERSPTAEPHEPRTRHPGRIKRALGIGAALVAAGSIANTISDIQDFEWGDWFGDHPTELNGGIGNVHTKVEDYHGIVTARISSKVDLKLERNLHHFVVADCTEKVDEEGLPLSGLLVATTDQITVTPDGEEVKVSVSGFDQPELGLPLDRPVLSEGDSWNTCVQRTGKESKRHSPENVPVILAGDLLKAASVRIGECVVNQANDAGSPVQKLLANSIAEQIAKDRGVDPGDVHVSFDFADSNKGKKKLEDTVDKIVKTQKDETGAEVTIDTAEVASCKLQHITAVLAPDAPA